MSVSLRKIVIEKLFGRIDLEIALLDGVNVLYGKNGTGKSTLLHVLANILNGSFERFAYLEFTSVILEFSNRKVIRISQAGGASPGISIYLGDHLVTSFEHSDIFEHDVRRSRDIRHDFPKPVTATTEKLHELRNMLRESVGIAPAAYFPAFRTMIEAWWSVQSEERRERGYRRFLAELDDDFYDQFVARERGFDRVRPVTKFARRLFGDFVPILDYPSPLEIEQELSIQVDRAAYGVAVASRKILEDAFSEAFEALTPTGHETKESPDDLLAEIERLLGSLDQPEGADSELENVYERLRRNFPNIHTDELSDTAASVLAVYRNSLRQRIEAQHELFQHIDKYVASVNEFLDQKKLAINRRQRPESDSRPMRARPESPNVFVEFDDGSTTELRSLSSGERQIISMLYASLHTEGDVVLIDEPEISLHIEWQRLLLQQMNEQLGHRQLIVCTHSPEIGADYMDRFQEVLPKSWKLP